MAERRDGQLRIGVLSPLVAGSYMSAVLSAVESTVATAGGRVIAIQTLDLSQGGLDTLVPQYNLHAAWDHVAGFVVLVNAVDRTYLEALRGAGKPVVLLSEEMAGFSCPVVRPDNRSGVLQAVAHLVQHGHRRIAFVGSPFQPDARERLDAYRDVLTDHGIATDDSLLFETSDNLEGSGEAAGRAMLAAGLPSTAVVAATDFNALGVMKALGDAGLSLPDVTRPSWGSTTSTRPRRSAPPSPAFARASGRPAGSPRACSSRWWTDTRWLPGGIWCPPGSCRASSAAARPARRSR